MRGLITNLICCSPERPSASYKGILLTVAIVSQLIPFTLSQTLPKSVAIGRRTDSESLQLNRARAISQAGSQEDAERILRQYLLREPGSAEAHALLGLVKFREGQPDKSLDEYSLAAKYGSVDASDLRIVGLDYVKLHDLSSATRWLKASIKRDNKDWRTWRYLGGVEYSEERPEEAAAAFQECLVLDPANVLAEDGLARSHEALGQSERAGSEYRMAILWNSKRPEKSWLPLLHYGTYLRKTAHVEEAIGYLTLAASLCPGDWEVHAELGTADKALGNLQAAQSEIEEAVKLAPERMRLHFILAQIYLREGQKDKAAAEIKLYTAFAAKDTTDRSNLDR